MTLLLFFFLSKIKSIKSAPGYRWLTNCRRHSNCFPYEILVRSRVLLWRYRLVCHLLDGSHPSPFHLMIFSRHVELRIIRLHSNNIRLFILIFVKRFDSGDFLQGYFFCGIFIDSLGGKAIKVSFSKDHPSFLPFLDDSRPFNQEALLDFVVFNINLTRLFLIHMNCKSKL